MQVRNLQQSATFETSDTPLANWLNINGIRILAINKKLDPVIISLDNGDFSKINDLIQQWDSGNAIGNCAVFYKSYRMLIHRIKEG
jgi:hypothetical protein